MPISKVHPLKQIAPFLKDQKRFLVLGPLDIEPRVIRKVLKKVRPDRIILVDGGVRHKNLLTRAQLRLCFSVGDGDSSIFLPAEPMDVLLPVQKDFSDLSFVLKALVKSKKQIMALELLGFSSNVLEKRIDHLMFNLGEVEKITSKLSVPIILDRHFLFFPPGKNKFSYRGLFSLLAIRPVTLKLGGNCLYKLPIWTKLPVLSSRGLSNIGNGEIVIESKNTIVVYLAGSRLKE